MRHGAEATTDESVQFGFNERSQAFLRLQSPCFRNFGSFSPFDPLPFCPIFDILVELGTEAFNIGTDWHELSNMSDVQGYCMKCKQYGLSRMARKLSCPMDEARMAGFCSHQAARQNIEDHCMSSTQ